MLVLTRKSNQSIMIGDDVEISVLAIMGEKVRIGIAAPRSIPVFRKEVYVQIQRERGAGAEEAPGMEEALKDLQKAKASRQQGVPPPQGVEAGEGLEGLGGAQP